MAEVMQILAPSFKRSHARTAAFSAPSPAAGHRRPAPLLETPGHSRASLGRFLVGSLPLSPSPGVHRVLFVPSKSLFLQSCVSSGGSVVGLVATSSKRAYATPRSAAPRALPLRQATADPYLTGDTQTRFWLSLCGLGMHFVPFPGLSSSGDQVLGECTVPGELCVLTTSPSPNCLVESIVSGFAICVLWRAATFPLDVNHPGSQEDVVSSWEPAHISVEDAISGAEIATVPCLPALAVTSLPLCLQAEGAGPRPASSPLEFTQSIVL